MSRHTAIVVSILALCSFALVEAQVPLFKPLRSVSLRSNGNCDSGKRIGCADCSTVQLCQWNGSPIESSRYRCDSIDRARPYCEANTGTCSEEPSTDCLRASDLCPASGVFPQPTNCREYIFCDANLFAYTTSCPAGQVYKHSIGACARSNATRECFQVNCAAAASQNQWFTYTLAPRLYMFCSSTVGPMTFQCESETESFNQALRRCEFICPGEGNFAIPGEPSTSKKYYQCVLSGRVLTYTIEQCPGPLIFNSQLSRCDAPPAATTPSTGGG